MKWTTMPFGKFKGKRVDTLPMGYLIWLKENVDLRGYLLDAVDDALVKKQETHDKANKIVSASKKKPAKKKPAPKAKKPPKKKQKKLVKNEPTKYYEWAHPITGTVHEIPDYVSMDGRKDEECPFDVESGPLDEEYLAIVS